MRNFLIFSFLFILLSLSSCKKDPTGGSSHDSRWKITEAKLVFGGLSYEDKVFPPKTFLKEDLFLNCRLDDSFLFNDDFTLNIADNSSSCNLVQNYSGTYEIKNQDTKITFNVNNYDYRFSANAELKFDDGRILKLSSTIKFEQTWDILLYQSNRIELSSPISIVDDMGGSFGELPLILVFEK